MKRVSDEPAFVLHRYDWSETSLIVEVFTRHFGRVALAAKGVKRPTSSFRPILLPLQPLTLAYGGDGEIRTLKAAQWQGGHVMPTGLPLLQGYYASELLLRHLARDDPHITLFDAYQRLTEHLARAHEKAESSAVGFNETAERKADPVQTALRVFELLLLLDVGVLPDLSQDTVSQAPLQAEALYTLSASLGLRAALAHDVGVYGSIWCGLQTLLQLPAHNYGAAKNRFDQLFKAVQGQTGVSQALKPLLAELIASHSGGGPLRVPQVMRGFEVYS